MHTQLFSLCVGLLLLSCNNNTSVEEKILPGTVSNSITAVNEADIPLGNTVIAFEGVSLIDGISANPREGHTVIVDNGIIQEIGESGSVDIPENAEIVQGDNLTLMPGLIDAHFHYDHVRDLPTKFVRNGVTSLRDPGQWIETYDIERETGNPLPRLFLTGPHLDFPPPTYPEDAYLVRDKAELTHAMTYLIGQGVSGIKIYHRLPVGLIEETCKIAHKHGLPVTAHLEITDARQAILAGLDGVEHVTSLGTALISRREAERYRQNMMADNNARKRGRLEMWKDIDIHSEAADSLLRFLVEHQTFLTPTLGAFEYRLDLEESPTDTVAASAFQKMMDFTSRCHQAKVRVVVGSHGKWIRYGKEGYSFHHEMELLAETGMDNMKIIQAATIENARFFKIDHRLGSIEKGKQADLILIEGDPVQNIQDIYHIQRVMLNGSWIE